MVKSGISPNENSIFILGKPRGDEYRLLTLEALFIKEFSPVLYPYSGSHNYSRFETQLPFSGGRDYSRFQSTLSEYYFRRHRRPSKVKVEYNTVTIFLNCSP